MWTTLSLWAWAVCALSYTAAATNPPNFTEGRVIAECLQRFGGLTLENAERLQRYKEWSDTYEEIPCFTSCYLSHMYDFYNATHGFQPEGVTRQFGRPLYDACKHRMAHGRDSCELAYTGFHCIVSLEDDPFVVIENMQQLSGEARNAMTECLHLFDQYEWQRINDYAQFPAREPIPCYTKCFIDKLQVFSESTRQWNVSALRTKLGVPTAKANVGSCQALRQRRSRNSCQWIYKEFTCFVLAGREPVPHAPAKHEP